MPQPVPLEQLIESTRIEIDNALRHYLAISCGVGCGPELAEAIEYSLLAPGKRLRPMLAILACEACGGLREAVLPAACAVEMIHAYSLIHDDLPAMDDDDLRRGRPTCHKVFGEAMAILAGDALLALAFQVLSQHTQPAETAQRCTAYLARAAGPCHLVGGQADDMSESYHRESPDSLESIHRRKTGAMILAPLVLGAWVAGAAEAQVQALQKYGQAVGLAFQITDDLLDVRGDETAMGKRLGKDSGAGKTTYPRMLGIPESSQRAEQLIDEACQAIEPFGSRAEALTDIARYVLARNR